MTIQASSGVRDELRSATRQVHQATDELIGQHANVGSPSGYPTFLSVMHHAFTHFGSECDRVSAAVPLPVRAQRLRACLESDLRALGASVASDGESKSSTQPAPSLSWAYGSAYALEGSALGAAVLRKAVRVDQQHATSYLDSLIGDRRVRWPTFTGALDALVMGPGDFDDMTRGALAVFEQVQSAARHLGGVQ